MSKAEEFILNNTRHCSNRIDFVGDDDLVYHPWLFPNEARRVAEIVREEAIDKACEYLNGLIEFLNAHGHGLKKEFVIEGLKQAMKDE